MLHAAGAIGPVLLLVAFYMASSGRWSARSTVYQLLNLVGSLILIVYSVILEAWVSVGLNAIWSLIAGFELLRARTTRF